MHEPMTSNTIDAPGDEGQAKHHAWLGPALYPNTYTWYIFVNALDLMFTWIMLHFGGSEMNFVADYFLQRWDLAGMVVFKFTLVSFVILICEIVGRRKLTTGLYLAQWGVGITCIPILLAILQLLTHPLE